MRCFLLLLALATPAFATNIFIEMPSTAAVEGMDASTFHTLIRHAVSSLGHTSTPNPNDAKTTLRPSLLKLGSTLIIAIDKIEDGHVTGSSKLKAANVEEADDVTLRVVRALLADKTVAQDARPTDITQTEARAGTRRKASRSGTNFSGGMSFGSGINTEGIGYYLSLDRAWAMGNLYLGFGFEFAMLPNNAANTAILGGAHIGAQYYFLDEDFSPFVGLDFGPSFIRDGTANWYTGVGLGGSVGVGFFRTYDVHARVGFRVASILTTAAPTTPIAMAVFVGVGF